MHWCSIYKLKTDLFINWRHLITLKWSDHRQFTVQYFFKRSGEEDQFVKQRQRNDKIEDKQDNETVKEFSYSRCCASVKSCRRRCQQYIQFPGESITLCQWVSSQPSASIQSCISPPLLLLPLLSLHFDSLLGEDLGLEVLYLLPFLDNIGEGAGEFPPRGRVNIGTLRTPLGEFIRQFKVWGIELRLRVVRRGELG